MPQSETNGITVREADLIIDTIKTLRSDMCKKMNLMHDDIKDIRKEQGNMVYRSECNDRHRPLEGMKMKFYMLLGGCVLLSWAVPICVTFLLRG